MRISLRNKLLIRWIAGTIGALVVILVAFQILLLIFLNPIMENMLTESVKNASGGRYSVHFDKLRFNIFTRSIQISGLKIGPDTANVNELKKNPRPGRDVYIVYVPKLYINHIDLLKAWRKKEISISDITLAKPEVSVLRTKDSIKVEPQEEFELSAMLPKGYRSFRVTNLYMNDGRFSMITNRDTASPAFSIDHASVRLKNVYIDSLARRQNKALYFADDMEIHIRDYQRLMPDDLHVLHVEETDIIRNDIRFKNIRVEPDSLKLAKENAGEGTSPQSYTIVIPELDIGNIDIFTAFSQNDIYIEAISIPELSIAVEQGNRPKTAEEARKRKNFDIAKLLPSSYQSFQVKKIDLGHAAISYRTKKSKSPMVLNDVAISIDNLEIDTTQLSTDKRLFYADDVELHVKNYKLPIDDKMYSAYIGEMVASTAKSQLSIYGVRLKPRYEKYKFAQVLGRQTDRFDMRINSILAFGVDLKTLLTSRALIADKVAINGLNLYAFRDKRVKRVEEKVPTLQQMITGFDYYFNIPRLRVNDASFTYEEHGEKAAEAGIVKADHVNADISYLSNDNYINTKHPMEMHGEGTLMNAGHVQTQLRMPLNDPEGHFTAEGVLDNMKFTDLNPMIEPATGVLIKGGIIEKMRYEIQGDNREAHGKMEFYYHDLEIALKDKETGKTNGVQQTVGSFVVNNLVIASDNPKKNKPFRTGAISYTRNENRAMLNYMWNAILSGVQSSIGVSEELQKLQQLKDKKGEMQDKKNERKEKRQEKKEERQSKRDERRQNREERKAQKDSQ